MANKVYSILTIRLDPAVYAAVQAEARVLGWSITRYINESLAKCTGTPVAGKE